LAAQNEASSTPFWLTALVKASARRIATAGSSQPSRGLVPPEGGRDAADALWVEHLHRAAFGADAAGQGEHVVFGGGGEDGPGVVQDDAGQPSGLAAAGRAEDGHVLVQPR